jgi:hypothetical protein
MYVMSRRDERMSGMGTYYKPSQWRGKRLVYRSTDPDEPRHEIVKIIRFLIGGIVLFGIIWFSSRWTR